MGCARESVRLLVCPESLDVTFCSVCGSKLVGGRWQYTEKPISDLASDAVNSSLFIHQEIQSPKVEISLENRGATRYMAHVNLTGRFRDVQVEERCQIPVKVIPTACDRCSRIAGKYFEATVQIRGSERPPSENELNNIKMMAQSMADSAHKSGDQLSFIQEIKKTKGGIDIVLGSTQLGKQLARAVYERYGGHLQESCTLAGRKDGRDIYRTTILVRFPRLKRGDFVTYKGTIYEVTGFEGKKTIITSQDGGRRSSLSGEDADRIEVLGNRSEAKKAVVVLEDEKAIEILDPESFRTVLAPRPRGYDVKPGDEVLVLRNGDGFIVLR